ncbi:MAG: heparinase II/III family protein [Parvularculaceae bacterium]
MAGVSQKKSARDRGIAYGVVDRMQRAWGESPFYQAQLKGPAPDRLGYQPVDPYTPDKALAESIVRGRIAIGAMTVECEGEHERLWDLAGRDGALHDLLHRFVWLRHLSALGERGRAPARALAQAWFDDHEKWSPDSWEPYTTGERLINLCCHGQKLISGGDALWRSRVLTSMARQTRHLARSGHRAPVSYERLMTAMSLCVAALSLPGCESAAEKGLELLRRELRLQIRPDGGHVSRNPSRQLELVIRLRMVLSALEFRRMPAPGFLRHIIGRAAAHVQLFRSGDGRLAVFNGGYEDDARALSAALEVLEEDVEPTGFARHSGFQRLEAARTVLIADTGAARGGAVSGGFQSGGSFHFSSGRARLIGNCGNGAHLSGDWALALRQAAAHSALSSEPPAAAAVFRSCVVTHRRAEDARGQLLEIERAASAEPAAARHIRRFFLSAAGHDLRGEDVLVGVPGTLMNNWRLRFHLHPGVKASLARDGRSVILAGPNREGWRFRSNSADISLEKSVYCGESRLPQSTEQIVICPGNIDRRIDGDDGGDIVVKWAFRRMEGV